MKPEKRKLKMVEQFQCSGCTLGSDTKCGSFMLQLYGDNGFRCMNHSFGTFILGAGKIALGLPKGFNKLGSADKMDIWLYLKEDKPTFNHLNVPVWAMVEDGFLFCRVFSPRVNYAWVVVHEDGKLPERAINVSEFLDEID